MIISTSEISYEQMGRYQLALVLGLGACTGTRSVTHKRWEEHQNRVFLHDITVENNSLQEAGSQLRLALEERLDNSLFIIEEKPKEAKYELKYKITQFEEGRRLKRLDSDRRLY